MRRPAALVRTLLARLRNPGTALLLLACALVAVMYACNHDMGGDDRSPRGDGRYRPVLARGDGHMLYLVALSTVLDGDWRFDDELARFGDPWAQPRTATGRKGIPHPIGPALVWAPFLGAAHGAAKVANVAGADIPEHGYTPWHQRIVFFSSVLFGCGAALLGLVVARRVVGGRWAPIYAAVAVLLGTSVTYYASIMPSYGHAMDAFFCAAFLACWAVTVGRDDLRRHALLGVLLGITALVRAQNLALGVVLAIEIVARSATILADTARRPRERLARTSALAARGALTLAVALLCFTPQLAMWKIVYGSFSLPHGEAYTRPGEPMIAELLWSARNGWLVTTPVAYLGVIGLLLLPARARIVGVGLLAAVAVQVYLNSIILDWWAQASFGNRRLCSVTLPVVVGLATLLSSAGRVVARWRRVPAVAWHALALLVLLPLVAWNLDQVWQLRGGKPAPTLHTPTCCKRVPAPLRGAAKAVYSRIGNPLQLPASLVFAIRHDTSLRRWDQVVGHYPIVLDGGRMVAGTWRQQTGTWKLSAATSEPFLLEGFSGPLADDRPLRRTTGRRARALIPNLVPAAARYRVWLAPPPGVAARVRLRFEGVVVADVELAPGWQRVGFDVARPPVGCNELWIESETPNLAIDLVEVGFVPVPPAQGAR